MENGVEGHDYDTAVYVRMDGRRPQENGATRLSNVGEWTKPVHWVGLS